MTLLFLDTSVLAEDVEVIHRVILNHGIPVITSIVLDELNHLKDSSNSSELVKANARKFFREIKNSNFEKIKTFPNGFGLVNEDNLSKVKFQNYEIYLIQRNNFNNQFNRVLDNDLKIIMTAKSYNGVILTLDNAFVSRAKLESVQCYFWDNSARKEKKNNVQKVPSLNNHPKIESYKIGTKVNNNGQLISLKYMPSIGENVIGIKSKKLYQLLKEGKSGGEGKIFEIKNEPSIVAKIYHKDKLTTNKLEKLTLMTSRNIAIEGVCWPIELIKNEKGEVLGYIMPKADGKTIQTQIMTKPALLRNFPTLDRKNLVELCIEFLYMVKNLHQLNIIIGDINPNNILINKKGVLYFVDTDSYQVENYPCPVGTVNFTAPEIQGKNYADFLRTKEHEIFAVTTMLFMLLLPGKPPYAQQDGEEQSKNIKAMQFPYPFGDKSTGKAPEGPWRNIWSNLPYKVKECFYGTFSDNKRHTIDELIKVMKDYDFLLAKKRANNALFPDTLKILDPIDICCSKCNKLHTVSEKKYKDRLNQGKNGMLCRDCLIEIRAKNIQNPTKKADDNKSRQPYKQTSTHQSSFHQISNSQYSNSNSFISNILNLFFK